MGGAKALMSVHAYFHMRPLASCPCRWQVGAAAHCLTGVGTTQQQDPDRVLVLQLHDQASRRPLQIGEFQGQQHEHGDID